jgi:hypothetical protein
MTRGRIAFTASALSVVLAGVLVSAAFWAPMYNDGSTLVDVNGTEVLIPVAVPLAITLIAFAGLWAKCSRGSNAGYVAAIVVMSLLGIFTLLAVLSIGIFVLPITALVATAVATTPDGRSQYS